LALDDSLRKVDLFVFWGANADRARPSRNESSRSIFAPESANVFIGFLSEPA
jgi:hypothetical protein